MWLLTRSLHPRSKGARKSFSLCPSKKKKLGKNSNFKTNPCCHDPQSTTCRICSTAAQQDHGYKSSGLVSHTVGKKWQPYYFHPTSGRCTCSTVLTMRANHDCAHNKNDPHTYQKLLPEHGDGRTGEGGGRMCCDRAYIARTRMAAVAVLG